MPKHARKANAAGTPKRTHPEGRSSFVLLLFRMIEERNEKVERVVCDYISGMTDQYSKMKFLEIFVPESWSR